VGRLLNYLLVPFHTYILVNPGQYGVVGEMYAWVALLLVLLTYGMETTFFRFSSMEKDRERVFNAALTMLLLTSSIFIAIGLGFAQNIANFLGYTQNSEYIRWFVLIVGLDALCAIPFARLRAENKPYLFAGIKIANIAINVFFNLFFLWFCPLMIRHEIGTTFFQLIYHPSVGVGYIFIANLIASIVQTILLWLTVKKIKLQLDRPLLKRMLRYTLPLLILGLAGIVNETIDRIMIKYLSPSDLAMYNIGIYSACCKIAIIMNLFIQAFRYSAEPFFFSIYKDKDAKDGYSTVMTYFVIVCTVIFLATMLYLDFIKYFINPSFHEGLGIVPILLLAYMLLGICFNLSIWYKLTGQTKYGAFITVGGAVVTVSVNFLLIPSIGYTGAAWGHFITYSVMVAASYLIGQKFYPVDYNLKKIGFYVLTSIILFALSYFVIPFEQFGMHQMLGKTIVNTLLLLLYLYIIYKKEYRVVRKIFG
jgi:O-antigen/teichoic acid export membrane protein